MGLLEVLRELERAAPDRKVKLIAVTKTVEPQRIREAFSAGARIFGENRIQEALPKIRELADLGAEWHFIGHLQTNKARDAVASFSYIQSVDSVKLLREIEKQAAKIRKNMDLLLELNLGEEASKHGFARENLAEALQAGKSLEWCKVRGLMSVPPYFDDPEQVRPFFHELRELRDRWINDFPLLTELSMGMSNDYMVAIQEGATMVRIGTAIFGERFA